ncbi:MAG: zinc-binding alcohol dehydrogenase family protein [Paraburkholderia sp.]|jgi:NADPH:quinone reductase-like Zn-dependent oxidoreductase|nr:zinc-binding alcohol dehydrogenase family protein [Paraburkholderia sp.]
MKAIQFKTFGAPDALALVDLPTPVPAAGSALVQVKSASVNPSDVKNVSGHFGHTVPPRVPGRDFSGVVAAGPSEWVGAEVWGTGGDIGFTRDGTHAEFIEIPAAALVRKPASLTHAQAASVGVNFVVGWLGTVDYAQLAAGETIAVIGVSGGVGGAVAQIARARGARVIGIGREAPDADSPAARLIDAFVPMDAGTASRVRELTGAAGADVVYDAVGGVAFELALALAKRRGRVVEISATGKRRVEFDLIDFYHNETQLLGADSAKLGVAETAPIMRVLAEAFDAGRFTAPVVARRYPLEQAREAYEAVAAGTRGRVVIDLA